MTEDDHASASHTDVLIIGAGPSGLMAAYWMARCGVRARIIDKKGTKVFIGHADGLRVRTLELFDSIGFQHRVQHEGHVAVEANFWVPGPNGSLIRQGPFCSSKVNESPFHNMLLSQGRIERFLLDNIKQHSNLEVERGVIAESFEYDELVKDDPNAFPITVKVRTLSENELTPSNNSDGGSSHSVPGGLKESDIPSDDLHDLHQRSKSRQTKTELVKAKYLIGCDGAHSWTRKQIDIPLEGSSTDDIWGVIDIIPITDFPDIRRLGTVTSTSGTMLVIPRERRLVRLYVPVHVVDVAKSGSARFSRSSITPEMIKERVQAILKPYTFDYKVCDWWTAYQIGQRIAPTFAKDDRIFLAGDAVHTHSPKVGLGMNMSMQDGFNIGWKVALVAAGVASPAILSTYHAERHRLAEMLLDFDRHWSGLFTDHKQPEESAEGGSDKTENMIKVVEAFEDFADGLKAFYGASLLVCQFDSKGKLSQGHRLVPGERFPPVKLRKQADGNTQWTTRVLESDGRFRLVILAGDVRNETQKQRIETLCRFLSDQLDGKTSPLSRYNAIPDRFNSPIDVMTIHSAPWKETEYFDFPKNPA
ncbi:uncharacterized protein N7477_002550 [Penicillium maclennaniae]|uniref:uncharacterized protein n=1 Tax=Penicillium maclennaniae TaxID=1343394 RepID=UPI002541833C|nr:uncharacterized protein N7477_002550 [Penicillium maclennaniae]KAJ5676917.1 hypothetical protein N7477_002550 [Penicillium maclennaniae]